ncbi:MAG TPA: response regulator transcription factor [Stellaceae bacterium]|nr:response regulator transcription factor [Stellaceae bacterium]
MAVRIVLADDHALVRRELRRLLEAEKDWLVCGETDNAEDAVHRCDTLRPDAAVLDISMPMMGGLEATKRIREMAPAIPVVLVSVHLNETLLTAAVDAGARGCILKSEAPAHLARAIRIVLRPDTTYFPPELRNRNRF